MPDRRHSVTDSPVGPLTLVAADGTLVGLHLADQRHLPATGTFGDRVADAAPAVTEQLAAYFDGELTDFDVRLELGGTAFQAAVWSALRQIPFGTTASYGALAAAVGRPGASRAVGLANGRNPVAIVVPCHRVIGADGSLTGYGGGMDRKRWLLDHEAAVVARGAPRPAGVA